MGDGGVPHDEVSDGVLESILEKVGPAERDASVSPTVGGASTSPLPHQLAEAAQGRVSFGPEEIALLRAVGHQLEVALAELEQVKKERDELGNALAREKSKSGGSFDQWALLQNVVAERDRLAEAAQAVVKNWRGNNRGWVNPDQLAPALSRLRAALASMEGDKDGPAEGGWAAEERGADSSGVGGASPMEDEPVTPKSDFGI